MKKIINGKMYNTDTAKWVGEYTNGYYPSDGYYIEENLYLKKTGEFFLCAKGGGLSKYAKRYGNCTGEGSEVNPITILQAKEWVERHLDADIYIKLFGEPEE